MIGETQVEILVHINRLHKRFARTTFIAQNLYHMQIIMSTYIIIVVFFFMNVLNGGANSLENLYGVALILNQFGRGLLVTIFNWLPIIIDKKMDHR